MEYKKCGKEIPNEESICHERGESIEQSKSEIQEQVDNLIKAGEKKKHKKKVLIVIGVFLIILAICGIFYKVILTSVGNLYLNNKNFYSAIKLYSIADNDEMITETNYQEACYCLINKEYTSAYYKFLSLNKYKDSVGKAEETRKLLLEQIYGMIESKDFEKAKGLIEIVKETEGVEEASKELTYQEAKSYEAKYEYQSAKLLFKKIKGYKDVDKILNTTLYAIAGNCYRYANYGPYSTYCEIIGFWDNLDFRYGILHSKIYELGESLTTNEKFNLFYTINDNVLYYKLEGGNKFTELKKIESVIKDDEGEATKIKMDGKWYQS